MMEDIDLAKRMMTSAEDYERTARLLQRMGDQWHWEASTHLSILAFEIALKCVFLLDHGRRCFSHEYLKIWQNLSASTQNDVLQKAKQRSPGCADLSNLHQTLDALQRTFSKGRYSYEANASRSETEIDRPAKEWIERGALDSEADFAYYPKERYSLFYGLRVWLERKTNTRMDLVD